MAEFNPFDEYNQSYVENFDTFDKLLDSQAIPIMQFKGTTKNSSINNNINFFNASTNDTNLFFSESLDKLESLNNEHQFDIVEKELNNQKEKYIKLEKMEKKMKKKEKN